MKRMQLFELEDQQWFPKNIRNYMTDFLAFGSNKFNLYKGITPIIEKGLEKSGSNNIIDLGSGSGGGLLSINKYLKEKGLDYKIVMTDYYPNIEAFKNVKKQDPESFDYVEEPVDARDVPAELKGLRTQFISFHHFREDDAIKILNNAVQSKNPIAIFEAQQRSVLKLLSMFSSFLLVLFTTPFIRPFKVGRLAYTYLLPVIPVATLWDGMVSVLRTYTADELKNMISKIPRHENYSWEIEEIKSGPGSILYLLGYAKDE